MAERKTSSAKSRVAKKAYKRNQRNTAVRQASETFIGLIPGMGLPMAARSLVKAYDKFQRNR